jgi:hypothetical protein
MIFGYGTFCGDDGGMPVRAGGLIKIIYDEGVSRNAPTNVIIVLNDTLLDGWMT